MAHTTHEAHRFHDSYIIHSSAVTPAGDARASLQAVLADRHALICDPDWGWMGRIRSSDNLNDLALEVATPCWQAGQNYTPLAAHSSEAADWPGILLSVSKGDTGAWLGPDQSTQNFIPAGLTGMLSAHCARHWGQRFFHGAPAVGACATGLLTILEAARLIEAKRCPWAIAGVADRSLQDLMLGGFRSLGVCCGQQLPRAMEGKATGFAPAEGAGMFTLAPQAAAKGESWKLVSGIALGDASHETRCDDLAALIHMFQILWQHSPQPDAIICHGTGTAAGDTIEMAALNAGPWKNCRRICMKNVLGHSLGANSASELACALHGPWSSLWKIALGFGGHFAGISLEKCPF